MPSYLVSDIRPMSAEDNERLNEALAKVFGWGPPKPLEPEFAEFIAENFDKLVFDTDPDPKA